MKGWNGVRVGVYAVVVFAAGVLTLMAPLGAVDTRTARLIDEAIERHKPEIIKIRRFIHMNPELSNREFETARLIASKLSALGLETRTGVAKTGVVGLLRGGQPGPTVALRADMDALPIQETTNVPFQSLNPGVMHACGHDIHMAVALGTAMVLKDLKDRVKGGVKFIFQPAEEGPPAGEEGGAALMIREGVLENPRVSAIFGLHVWNENVGQVLFSSGNIMAASDGFQIVVKGRSAHGARPQEGVDAIVVGSHIVAALQTVVGRSIDPTDPAVVTVGRIEGGTRVNPSGVPISPFRLRRSLFDVAQLRLHKLLPCRNGNLGPRASRLLSTSDLKKTTDEISVPVPGRCSGGRDPGGFGGGPSRLFKSLLFSWAFSRRLGRLSQPGRIGRPSFLF
jgi:hypothetical protein